MSGIASTSACGGVEVHDAGAQHVAAADDGVRDEGLAAALQAIEQLAVERIEMAFDLRIANLRPKIARHVAEGRDAQVLRDELQLRMRLDRFAPAPATSRMSSAIIVR